MRRMIVISAMAVCFALVVVGCAETQRTSEPIPSPATATAGQATTPIAQPPSQAGVTDAPQAIGQVAPVPKGQYPAVGLTQVGPGHWRVATSTLSLGTMYDWFDGNTLLVTPGDASGSIIDLSQEVILDPNPIPIPKAIAAWHKVAIAPSLDEMAYMRPGELVIQERSTGRETTWKIGTSTVDSYYLWWSPDGRYLLGSQASAFLRASGDRVWYLDRQTGVIKGLIGPKADGLVYYECSWSPDGQQVVLRGGLPKESLGSAEYLWVNITSG
ncbi:MAG: hypothetical protein ACM3ZQ_08695 [Bacillota bacterium]